jgi:eukaryotic-like serine/threonine-protein kinase
MSTFSPAIRDFLAVPEDARRLGPYWCKEVLDKSGTAPVFKAFEEHAGLSLRSVAVKVFDIVRTKGDAKGDAEDAWQTRVVDEARSLCRVQHPNVIRFHTLSTDAKRGLMGLVMEFAEGISVDRQLQDLPQADARRVTLAVEIGINISSALGAAHEAGIVHCNVKPSNIMFTNGTHKLINFGIAASLHSTDDEGTDSERRRTQLELDDLAPESIGAKAATLLKVDADSKAPITGAIGYLDPVCLRTTAQPTAASDLYSLGATLYQCLAGDVPAVATRSHGGGAGVDAKVLVGDAPAALLADVAPFAPPDLAKLVDALVSPARDARPRSADAVRRSLERIRSALAGRERTLPPEERGPFPGLGRYDSGDRDVFFGRSAEIAGMIELARTRGLVSVVGLSGTGMSSLARAGVIPAIEEGALEGWPTKYRSVVVTPGTDLMAAFRAALSKVVGAPIAAHPAAIAQQLADDVDEKGEGVVILVDQLEEMVTLRAASGEKGDKAEKAKADKADKARLEALDLLSRLADAHVGVRVIVTARRDLLDEILAIDPHFSRALSRGVQPLGPLSSAGWEEVLDQSLEAYGYRFEDAELRREVLAELRGRESAMPLAQFGLTSLWEARDAEEKTITRAAFSAKGGMRGALEQHADATVATLSIPRETLRDVLLAMTTPEGTRARVEPDVLAERFGQPARDVVLALSKAHLIAGEGAGVTFAHDAILREWSLLRGWIENARDDRLLLAHLERDAARWEGTKDAAELWRKSRLAASLELWKRGSVTLSHAARTFLRMSRREEQKVKLAFFTLVSLVLFLIVGGSIVYAKQSSDRAVQARKDADALEAALADVKVLKRQADENGLEAAVTAGLLNDLQKKMAEERASFGANVDAEMKKATSLDNARKATADLNAQRPAQNQLVPLPMDLSGPGGPSAGGGGTFDQAAIERVVNARKAGVKRTCLERSTSTAPSTKVTTTLTIAPSGAVQSVTSTSDDLVIAKCIEQQVQRWTFPAPGEVKQVQIPFVFVRQ